MGGPTDTLLFLASWPLCGRSVRLLSPRLGGLCSDEIIKQDAFDSSVHISEEASNAALAVPWAIVSAISIAGVLGLGAHQTNFHLPGTH